MKKEKLKGIGGFLLLFVILSTLYLLSNIIQFIRLLSGLEFQNSLIFGIAWFVAVVTNIFYLIFIFRKSRRTKKVIFIGKPLEILANLLVIYTAWTGAYMTLTSLSINTQAIFTGIIQIVLEIVWIFYFAKSKRVKSTLIK